MEEPRVLSIQSHVVRGYVGNKSATFPLQVLGFEVDAINSVQLSNHTGYRTTKGQILNEADLGMLIDALEQNNLHHYSHLLTGYVGSPSFLNQIANVVKRLKAVNPSLIYVCDPVMGDEGKMYVPESLLPIYKETIIPLADIVTPNQFELELLTGKPVKTMNDAWKAINTFHEKGCKTVIISSSNLGANNELITLASILKDGENMKAIVKIPKLQSNFTGTGDLFAALFLAWMHRSGNNLIMSLDNTIATLQSVLKRTLKAALDLSNGKEPSAEQLELRLVQSKHDIENPKPEVHAELV
ncbi:hypothetical protein AAG570_011588 [Ranatra chinensis]|uniref:Pyridoxal kinase n=1 Tax=Ranatra chinensis TaxID=642074 RepID=A0ABD0YZ92_9HEMI